MGSDGEFAEILFMPDCRRSIDQRLNTIKMQGKETYKQAVTAMSDAADRACVSNMTICLCYSASGEHENHRSDRPPWAFRWKSFTSIWRSARNASAAVVAIALDEAHRTGRFKIGDYILLVLFGGGLTWASSVVRGNWHPSFLLSGSRDQTFSQDIQGTTLKPPFDTLVMLVEARCSISTFRSLPVMSTQF